MELRYHIKMTPTEFRKLVLELNPIFLAQHKHAPFDAYISSTLPTSNSVTVRLRQPELADGGQCGWITVTANEDGPSILTLVIDDVAWQPLRMWWMRLYLELDQSGLIEPVDETVHTVNFVKDSLEQSASAKTPVHNGATDIGTTQLRETLVLGTTLNGFLHWFEPYINYGEYCDALDADYDLHVVSTDLTLHHFPPSICLAHGDLDDSGPHAVVLRLQVLHVADDEIIIGAICLEDYLADFFHKLIRTMRLAFPRALGTDAVSGLAAPTEMGTGLIFKGSPRDFGEFAHNLAISLSFVHIGNMIYEVVGWPLIRNTDLVTVLIRWPGARSREYCGSIFAFAIPGNRTWLGSAATDQHRLPMFQQWWGLLRTEMEQQDLLEIGQRGSVIPGSPVVDTIPTNGGRHNDVRKRPPGTPTQKIRQRAHLFKSLKDDHPDWSYVRVAMEANRDPRKVETIDYNENHVRNAYTAMGWAWERADRIG